VQAHERLNSRASNNQVRSKARELKKERLRQRKIGKLTRAGGRERIMLIDSGFRFVDHPAPVENDRLRQSIDGSNETGAS
jgi:hypothetical protein